MTRRRIIRDEAYYAKALEGAALLQEHWEKYDEALKRKAILTLRSALIDDDGWPHVYVNSETGRVYRPHNDPEREVVYSDTPRYLLVRGGEGGGKALALDTPLPTPTGWTTMGEVQINDELLDERGFPCTVTKTSFVMEGHTCYEVEFDDGRTLIADANHLWVTMDSPTRKSLARCDPDKSSFAPEIRTTQEIKDTLLDKRGFRNHSIELASPLDLVPIELPIDPYMLGVWLGDGSSYGARVTIGKEDQEEMIPLIEATGHSVIQQPATPQDFGIDTDISQQRDSLTGQFYRNEDSLHAKLDRLGLIKNKHIPPQYLRAGSEQRLALLQGLMDTDGYISERGKCEFCSASERLASDFEELCMTLALKVVCRKGDVFCGESKCVRYRFCFTPHIPVFRMPRKAERIKPYGRHSSRQFRRFIVGIWEHESVPVKCVTVDSPSHLFLAGRGMIPTHNSVAGIIKTLQRIRRGMSGLMCSPNLPHLRRSLWPEFRRWCPWDRVVKKHQRFGRLEWEPHEPWNIVFKNNAVLHCTGIENPGSLEGPNLSFAHFDEARHHPDGKALKVLDGRVRIPGPKGEPPQIFLTTTPALNWLYEYFGPVQVDGNGEPDDPYAAFKADARDIVLLTVDNEVNLFEGFAASRSQTLTEKEARVLLEAAWEDLTDGQPFLPDISWWDGCKEELPPLAPDEPMVLALDAATGRTVSSSDCFAVLGLTRHPDPARAANTVAVRYAKIWQVRAGHKIDYQGTWAYPGPEREIARLCGFDLDADGIPVPAPGGGNNVLAVVYDPTELHDMATRMYRNGVAWFKPFSQGILRNEADRQLLEMIKERRVVHDGNDDLREHVRNADRKTDESGHRMRIVKRTDNQKIDLAVALSMGSYEAMRLNL